THARPPDAPGSSVRGSPCARDARCFRCSPSPGVPRGIARATAAASVPAPGRVEALSQEGWGVIRGAGKTVFVAGALPGVLVEYRVRRRQRSHDEAELVTVLEAAPDRIEPRCPHFGTCGGCALQHLAPG